MKRDVILVTGGSGYIGSHTILELMRNTNFGVISIDNFVNSYSSAYENIETISGKKIENYSIDLCDDLKVEEFMKQHGKRIVAIIHFAALKSVPESTEFPLLYYKNNTVSLLNVLKYGEEAGIPYFIFSSSCSIYGNVQVLPVKEDTPEGVAESPYANTKQIGEDIIRNFSNRKTMKTILLRYFNPVGADMTGLLGENPRSSAVNNLVPIITQTAAGLRPSMQVFGSDYKTRDGSCIRDYIHVTDISMAHVKATLYLVEGRQEQPWDVYNLGSGTGVTVFEAIAAFEKVSGVKLNYIVSERRAGDVEAIYSDSGKAKKLLQWECKYNLEDMMQSAWKWQQKLLAQAK